MSKEVLAGAFRGADRSDALVLIHGSGDSARCWDGVLQRLGNLPAHVIALDLPGHGARIAEPALAPTVDACAAWVRDQLRAERIERAVLAGHSLGSAIVLQLAITHPDLTSHAVLIGSGARLRVLPDLLERARTDPPGTIAQLVRMGHATEHDAFARASLAALAPSASWALANDLQACDCFDVIGQLEAVRVPTSILVGDQDRLTPPKYAQYLAAHIHGAHLTVVPGAGHYLMAEAPDEVARVLRDALS